jgi:hypothetical protein
MRRGEIPGSSSYAAEAAKWAPHGMCNAVPAPRACHKFLTGPYPFTDACDLQRNELMSRKPTECLARRDKLGRRACALKNARIKEISFAFVFVSCNFFLPRDLLSSHSFPLLCLSYSFLTFIRIFLLFSSSSIQLDASALVYVKFLTASVV